MSRFKNQGGMTLIETIIGLALLSMAMLVAVLVYTTIVKLQNKSATGRSVQQNGRYVIEGMMRDIRNAKTVGVPSADTVAIIDTAGGQIAYCWDGSATLKRLAGPGSCTADGVSIASNAIRVTKANFELIPSSPLPFVNIELELQQRTVGLLGTDVFAQTYTLSSMATVRGSGS
jgi:prepilin-type N-terminal cleavage/methylation domain-containing protein